jgi:hypothetical protein
MRGLGIEQKIRAGAGGARQKPFSKAERFDARTNGPQAVSNGPSALEGYLK